MSTAAPTQIVTPLLDFQQTLAKIQTVEKEMREVVIGQPKLVHETILCALAFVNPLFIGERGIAKTMAIDEFHAHMDPGDANIEGIRKFYVLCSKSMPPDVLLGHLSVKQLVENDVLAYQIKGKLPAVHIATADEIFKNNSVNLNAMLGIINERRFLVNGEEVECPLWFLAGLSNVHEYPGQSGELDAFRDRFGCTLLLNAVEDSPSVRRIFEGQLARYSDPSGVRAPARTMMTLAEMELLQREARAICEPSNVPPEVMDAMIDLRQKAALKGLRPSLRRFGQLWQRMGAHSLMNGRKRLTLSDLTLAQDMLWTDLEDISTAFELIVQHAGTGATAAVELHKALDPLVNRLNTVIGSADPASGIVPTDAMMEAAKLNSQVGEVWKRYERKVREATAASEDTSDLDLVGSDIQNALDEIQKILVPQGVRKP